MNVSLANFNCKLLISIYGLILDKLGISIRNNSQVIDHLSEDTDLYFDYIFILVD